MSGFPQKQMTRRGRQLCLWQPRLNVRQDLWRDDRRGVRPQMPAKSRTKTRSRPSRALLVCILLFAFCLREPVADGTKARVQTVLGRRAPRGQPLPVGDQLVGRDENANRGSSLCRVACCSHVVVGQMRSTFVVHCCAVEHSDDNTSSSSLYRFLCVFCLTSIYGIIALTLSCRVGQACQNTVALDSHQLCVSLRGV